MSQIVFNSPQLESEQVENLQTTLASLNQVVYSLQEALQGKEQENIDLKKRLTESDQLIATPNAVPTEVKIESKTDDSMTIVGALMNLYKFIFPPRKII